MTDSAQAQRAPAPTFEPGPGAERATGSGPSLSERLKDAFGGRPDLMVVAALLLAIAIGSRPLTRAIHVGPLYVTEILMGLAAVMAVVRLGPARTWEALRRLPLVPLGILWGLGLLATMRGLADYSLDDVRSDIGLFDYSLVVALIALVVTSRKRFSVLAMTLVACGFCGVVAFVVTFTSDELARRPDSLLALQSVASGLYMSFAAVWVAARVTQGVPTSRWLIATVPLCLLLMALTTQRSVWIVAILALGAVVAFAPRPRRLRAGAVVVATMVVAFGAAIAVETALDAVERGIPGDGPAEVAATENAHGGGGEGGTQLTNEVSGLVGDSGESANVKWRLAYWKELVSRTPDSPLVGVGFGKPAAFTWNDVDYDYRDGTGEFDVTGPHNAFVSTLYRLGIPALIVLVLLIFLALRNVWRALRAEGTPEERVTLVTLAGILAASIGTASFNEAFTAPYLGIFFWVSLGMLLLWPALSSAEPEASSSATLRS